MSELLFASFKPEKLDPALSIGNKFSRLLDALELTKLVKGKSVAVKMHVGGGGGFSTIHPFFVRKLVCAVREAGAEKVFVTDLKRDTEHCVERGYTEEVLTCPIVPVCGEDEKDFRTFKLENPVGTLDRAELSGPILDPYVLLDFSHVKGHGVCGFGGASKNLSMGAVTDWQRAAIHALEGGLVWNEKECIHCGKCEENCPNKAISFKDGKIDVFYHNCKFCQHCVLICPEKALKMTAGGYTNFQRGMAATTAKLLEQFKPENRIFINMLMDTTIFCDCWGMTTPRLIPDIGILASVGDIAAIEQATLDLVNREQLIPGSLPDGWDLEKDVSHHIFERIHHKDPYVVVRFLEESGCGESSYTLREIK